MAEAFGIVGAAIGVAAEGLRLSQTLYDFVENVRLADTDIKEVADDVSSTAIVLQQFEASLKLDEESMICTREFHKVTSENIEGCSAAFASIDKALQKSIKAIRDIPAANGNVDQVFELRKRDKFWWPFHKQRVENHRRNLDRLKANLNLKMQVMAHAREIHERQKASRASENEEKIKALRVEALALEVQEAERKYQEIKNRTDETQIRFQKEPEKGETNVEKDLQGKSSQPGPENSQYFRAEGQSGDFEGSSSDGPSSELQHSAAKVSGENGAHDISSLPFSKIEVLLSRIAGAQEAIVLAAEKQGPPVRFTDSTKSFDSEPLQQVRGARKARVTGAAYRKDLQQNARQPEDERRRRILDQRPLDRIARVQERLAELTESPGLSHMDQFSLREESTESEDDYVFHTPTDGIENFEITEGSNKPVQHGEDAVKSVTDEKVIRERRKNELRVARETDRSSFEAEPNDRRNNERNEWLIPTSDSNENRRPNPESERRVRSKGKDKQHALEEVPRRPRPLTDFTENPTPLETTDEAGIERAQRLTPSTGALVLYANRSTWVRQLTNDPSATFDECKLSLHLLDSLPLSSSTVTNRSTTSLTAAAPELQPLLPRLKDTMKDLTNLKKIAEPSLDEAEEPKSPIRVKKNKQKEREEHKLLEKKMQQRKGLRNNRSEGANTINTEVADQEFISHDQINSAEKPLISNEQSNSLQRKGNRNHEEAEEAGFSWNDERLKTTDDQNPSTPLRSVSDAPNIIADIVQTSNRQGSGVDADNPNAAEANNQDIGQGPGEDQSASVEPIIISYSRLASLRAFLLPRFIRRREISRMNNDNAEDTHSSTISGKSAREGKRRTHGLRLSRRLAMLINPKRLKKRRSTLKRNVKTWFFASRRHSSSSISGRSYADNSSYSYYTYSESFDEEGNNQLATVRPTAGESSPKSESGERIASRRPSKIPTNMPPASKKPPLRERYGRNSQQQAQHQKPDKPSKIADERVTENLFANQTLIPNELRLVVPEVDLDQRTNIVTHGFIGSYEHPILEAWLLRPSDPLPGQPRSWRRARRIYVPIGAEELVAEVDNFNRKAKRGHSKPVWTVLRSLSSDQQQQIERLMEMKRTCDTDRRFQWSLVALKVSPSASSKLYDSLYIEVILKKSVDLNAWRATIDTPLASVPHSLPASNVNMITRPPEAPRSSRSRRSLTPSDSDQVRMRKHFEPSRQRHSRRSITPPHAPPRRKSPPASSFRRRESFSGSEGIRVVGLSSSDEELNGRKHLGRFKSSDDVQRSGSKGRTKEEAMRRAEQWVKREADQHSRKRSVVEDKGKGKAKNESERATGLGEVNSRITGLERMLKDHERRLEKLRTEESKKRSYELPLRTSEGDRLDQRRRSLVGRFHEEPIIQRGSRRFQYYSDSSPDRGRDANALDLHGASPYPLHVQSSYEHLPRSRYSEVTYLNPAAATELPGQANETGISQPRPRRHAEDDSRDRPAKPAVRFRDHKPSTSQDFSPGIVSSASKDSQSLGLSGPLFGPAGSQFRPPSPMAPGTSMPSLNPTLNTLISQWTTLKLDIPKEKQQQQQPTDAATSPSNEGNKGNRRQPRSLPPPQTSKPHQLSTYNDHPPSGSVAALPPPPASEYKRTSTSHNDPLKSYPYTFERPGSGPPPRRTRSPPPPLNLLDDRRDPEIPDQIYLKPRIRRERRNTEGEGEELAQRRTLWKEGVF